MKFHKTKFICDGPHPMKRKMYRCKKITKKNKYNN